MATTSARSRSSATRLISDHPLTAGTGFSLRRWRAGAARPTMIAPAAQTPPPTPRISSNAPSGIMAATRSAPTPPTSPPKAAAAATRASSGLAACGSKHSLSSDQKVEIAIAPSTEECAYSRTVAACG